MYQDHEPIIKKYSVEFRKFGENDKLNDFIKREEKLLRELQTGSREIDAHEKTNHKHIRAITFGNYEQIEEVKNSMKSKDKDMKIKLFRCNENSVKYIDFVTYGNRIIVAKQ